MMEPEDVLGGDIVHYAYPKEIKKQLTASMKEIAQLKRNGQNDKDVVFRLVRIMVQIWQTHPFRKVILGDDKLAILDNLVGIIPAQEAADKNTIKEERLARKWVE